jgi:hypothetical protein
MIVIPTLLLFLLFYHDIIIISHSEGRIGIAAQMVGLAQGALDNTLYEHQ